MLVPSDNKQLELTDKQKNFLDALFGEANGDPKIAGEIAGYSHYTVPLKALKDEIIDRAEQVLDRIGLVKREKIDGNAKVAHGIFILPPKNN